MNETLDFADPVLCVAAELNPLHVIAFVIVDALWPVKVPCEALTMKPLKDEPESVTVTDSPADADEGALNDVVALPLPPPWRLGTEQPPAPDECASQTSGIICSTSTSTSTSWRSGIPAWRASAPLELFSSTVAHTVL